MTTHSSILAWKIPWRKKHGGLQYMNHKMWDMTEPACTQRLSSYISWFQFTSPSWLDNNEQTFICLFAIHISLVKYLFESFSYFLKIELFVLWLSWKVSSDILETSSFIQIFPLVCYLLFQFHNHVFSKTRCISVLNILVFFLLSFIKLFFAFYQKILASRIYLAKF